MADLVQIIKYEGDNSTFIWKHPIEDFNTGTQLIVHESQEAIFFMNGQALDIFGSGRHELTSQNIPLIGKFFRRATDDKTPFHCEVYFINKTEQMAVKWGTDSKIEYVEPTYKFPLKIGASGEMSLLAEDGRKLLVKLVGTERDLSQASLIVKFRGLLMTRVKTYLANLIREKGINIFSIDEHLADMSDALKVLLIPDFADYGVHLAKFWLMNIVKPEEDRSYQKFKELHFRQYADVAEAQLRQQVGVIEQQTQAQRMIIEAQGIAQKRAMEGFTYQEERGFDVAQRVASNEAVGQMSNLGIGLGVMAGVGGTVGGAVGGMMQNTLGNLPNSGAEVPTTQVLCSGCNAALPQGAKFCLSCGKKVEAANVVDMVCPACGKPTPKGKFCAECGAPLKTTCPKCGKDVPQGAKFCPDCGQPQ
ncbi:MAG: SPFH domain-containing protein [Clostridiales bacterium]|nr:SPFH domain-containing protein [Clostridiales bacterium]